jgi:hypothetical protein
MPAVLDVNVQQTTAAWKQVATISNLSAGKGKDRKKSATDPFKTSLGNDGCSLLICQVLQKWWFLVER